MRILLVEDNKMISRNIKKFLELEWFVVDLAYDGEHGVELFAEYEYDLVLLDVMLPKMDGIAVCKKLRFTSQAPVIMLTAKWELDDKAEGFGCGADDYLVKPFDLPELVMRMRSLLKRSQIRDVFEYKDIQIDLEAKKVVKAGKEVKLTIKEWMILGYLLDNGKIAVSRTSILDYVRGGENLWEGDDKLDVYISNLRKKLDKEFIETIKGFGYRLVV